MRAYQIKQSGQIENLSLVDRDVPKPGRGQVLVRMRAASLNYRDLMIITGTYGREVPPGRIPLSDGAGEVSDIGEGVTRFKTGDRVAGIFHQGWLSGTPTKEILGSALGGDIDGVLAEYVLFDEAGLVTLPEHLSYEEAATLPCAAVTAWEALFRGPPVRPGEFVLTQGTGGVSIFALQLARAAGARVIITSSSDEKLERASSLGAESLINYRTHPEWNAEVLKKTDGLGADQVVELGGAGTLDRSLASVRRGGTISIIGVLTGKGQIDPMPILFKQVTVRGIFVGSREAFVELNRAVAANELRPIIDKVFPFSDAVAAYRHLQSGSHFGKVVISMS